MPTPHKIDCANFTPTCAWICTCKCASYTLNGINPYDAAGCGKQSHPIH